MKRVTILDYGIGNILSVSRAFERCNAEVILTDSPKDAMNAEILVLPGVGAFADGMAGLGSRGLIEAIQGYCAAGKPFLGICLGMQMMFDESDEFGVYKGLGLIPGRVTGIEKTTSEGDPHKIPHVGWNELRLPAGKDISWWDDTILDGISDDDEVYFVHSFTAKPKDPTHRLADSFYGGRLLSAAVRKGNIYGCQFHPEKSGDIGIKIINNFLRII